MLIKTITLNNFRQYYGEHKLSFERQGSKNVTVIHGENGSGKTALLNAFNWVLYGVTDLPHPDQLINSYAFESANDMEKVEMFIELEFQSKGNNYILKRNQTGLKRRNRIEKEEEVSLQFYKDEKWIKLSNPTIEINRILPENLRNYFFFDGERIDNLSRHENNDEIRDAVKSVMDLEVIERGIKHTEDAQKEFRKEWANFADSKTKSLLEHQEKYRVQEEELKSKQEQIIKNIKFREEQIEDIDQQLLKVKGISEKQEERKRLEIELKKHQTRLSEIETKLKKEVSKQAYLAPTKILEKKLKEISMDSTNAISKYPGLTKRLVHSLMEQGTCICGEKLDEYHKYHLKEAMESIDDCYHDIFHNNLERDLNVVSDSRQRFFSEVKSLEKEDFDLKGNLFDTKNRLEEISADLNNREYEDIQQLEIKRKQFKEDANEFTREVGRIDQQMKELELGISEITKEIEKQQQIQDKAQLAKKRMETCEKLTSVMQRIYNLKEQEVKVNLQKKIQEVYGSFLRKGFQIKLTDDFKLTVHNYSGERVPLSQGERQITSLSFIGAIVDIARKTEEKPPYFINEGGIYPLVMDSPFGALDSDHRKRVAKGIHTLSEQIIIIVSTSQWEGEVENALQPFIGNEFTLQYHDPRHDQEIPYEYTEIKR